MIKSWTPKASDDIPNIAFTTVPVPQYMIKSRTPKASKRLFQILPLLLYTSLNTWLSRGRLRRPMSIPNIAFTTIPVSQYMIKSRTPKASEYPFPTSHLQLYPSPNTWLSRGRRRRPSVYSQYCLYYCTLNTWLSEDAEGVRCPFPTLHLLLYPSPNTWLSNFWPACI